MEPKQRKMKTIFTQRLAGQLMAKGFVLVGMEPMRDNDRKNVFFFNDSAALEKVIEEYKASSSSGKLKG